MKLITHIELYLTFLTHNDSYMQKIAAGEILHIINGNIYYKDKCSIDNATALLDAGFVDVIE